MKSAILLIALSGLLMGCRKAPEPPGIVVVRPFDYSEEFLKSLKEAGIKNAILDGDKFILDSTHQYTFPAHIKVFNMTAFFGQLGNLHIKLIAERIRQSTITYIILAGEDNQLEVLQEGTAHLKADFYSSAKTETNNLTGNTYIADEYIDMRDGCHTVISIGKEEAGPRLLARVSRTYDGKAVPLATEIPLTLVEK